MALSSGPGPTTTALYPGECPGCLDDIEPGDTIVRLDDRWVCEDCAHDADPMPGGRPRPVQHPPTTPWDGTSTEQMGY